MVAVSMLLFSCEKFLEPDSPSSFPTEYVFGTTDDAAKAVYGVYSLFNQDAYTSRLSNNFAGNTDVEAGGVGSNTTGSRHDIWSFEATAGNSDVRVVFNNAYNAINRANECIEGIKSSNLYQTGDPMMKQLLGEALTLRAFWYYYLVNQFGDVPFRTTPTRSGEELYLAKVDRNEILTSVINDLIQAEPDMMWPDQLDYGIERINRSFVIGFIARLALTRGGYALYPGMEMKRAADYKDYYKIANDYCKKLKATGKYSLINYDYASVFLNENQYVTPKIGDVLYEVAFYPGSGDVAWNNGVRVDGGTHPYGSGSNYLSLVPTYYHSFDTLDMRLPVTASIVYYDKDLKQQPVAITSIAPNKWNRLLVKTPLGASSAKGTGINWPIMRYADVLLMLAESENELNGPTEVAKEALKEVRERAFKNLPGDVKTIKVTNYVDQAASSPESFFDAIVNERAWEFGGECLRKYDLIRWNLYGKKIAETRAELTQMGIDASTGSGSVPDYLYYKRSADEKTINFLNKYENLQGADIPPVKDVPSKGDNPQGYLRVNWAKSLFNSSTGGPANYILYNWRGYADDTGIAPVRYILPIPQETITASKGTLNNDGYGF